MTSTEKTRTPFIFWAVNIDSIGKPKDGDPRGCYAILTIAGSATALDQESIGVEFTRFDYNVEKAVTAIRESPLPKEYADMLFRGI